MDILKTITIGGVNYSISPEATKEEDGLVEIGTAIKIESDGTTSLNIDDDSIIITSGNKVEISDVWLANKMLELGYEFGTDHRLGDNLYWIENRDKGIITIFGEGSNYSLISDSGRALSVDLVFGSAYSEAIRENTKLYIKSNNQITLVGEILGTSTVENSITSVLISGKVTLGEDSLCIVNTGNRNSANMWFDKRDGKNSIPEIPKGKDISSIFNISDSALEKDITINLNLVGESWNNVDEVWKYAGNQYGGVILNSNTSWPL